MRLIAAGIVLVPVLILAGCATARPPEPTAEEQVLLTQIGRDRFVEVTALVRDDEGRLVVTTRQGDTTAHYLLAPAIDGGAVLSIRRLDEDTVLTTQAPEYPGTGPEPRGLAR